MLCVTTARRARLGFEHRFRYTLPCAFHMSVSGVNHTNSIVMVISATMSSEALHSEKKTAVRTSGFPHQHRRVP